MCASHGFHTATVCGSGLVQVLALIPGISRSGVTMVGELWRGLDDEDAARFAFLLATPSILAAGVLHIGALLGPASAEIHGQLVLGRAASGTSGPTPTGRSARRSRQAPTRAECAGLRRPGGLFERGRSVGHRTIPTEHGHHLHEPPARTCPREP
jgi:Bacitracin resistance protein BacA